MVGLLINDEWERSLKEVVVALCKVVSWNLSGRIGENYRKSQSRQLISQPRFEPNTPKYKSTVLPLD
jgi:hypothetical protein